MKYPLLHQIPPLSFHLGSEKPRALLEAAKYYHVTLSYLMIDWLTAAETQ